MDSYCYSIDQVLPGQTVRGVLTANLGASHTLIRRLAATDGIRLNGRPTRLSEPVSPGDVLTLTWPETPSPRIDPEPVPLDVIFEDADVIVVNKAPGQVVHPTHGCHHGTLANGLAWRFRERVEASGVHPVHRLDRETSGLVLFAKHAYAHQQLARQLEGGGIHREYRAIATGWLESDSGVIEGAIARLPGPGGRRIVADHGQPAITHYRVLARSSHEPLTWLSLWLETGRTHQIRVHLAHVGHPLVGDPLYGHPDPYLMRGALHAERLSFHHPRTRDGMALLSPVPADMEARLARTGLILNQTCDQP
jgi:RluA family pseudouridine synthase